ncbi:hypothetical protein, partial [Staphylococcus aureus]|uniref:hypothetical protein n=1 Tax=Staphylococcus aureus TaxID=1280 RepID=UPI0038B27B08
RGKPTRQRIEKIRTASQARIQDRQCRRQRGSMLGVITARNGTAESQTPDRLGRIAQSLGRRHRMARQFICSSAVDIHERSQ